MRKEGVLYLKSITVCLNVNGVSRQVVGSIAELVDFLKAVLSLTKTCVWKSLVGEFIELLAK